MAHTLTPSAHEAPPDIGARCGNDAGRLAELMERYGSGDDTVLEHLFVVLGPRVRRFCGWLADRPSVADDLFQETFLKLHRARATYMCGANVLPWIFAIARSAHLDRRRRRSQGVSHPHDASEDGAASAADGSGGPEAPAAGGRLAIIASITLHRMSERDRMAYVLTKEQGLGLEEAAAVLGTTVHAMTRRAQRAHQHILAAVQAATERDRAHELVPHAATIDA